jgi:hypothetical protein
MSLFSFYQQASDVGEMHSLVPGTVRESHLISLSSVFWKIMRTTTDFELKNNKHFFKLFQPEQ